MSKNAISVEATKVPIFLVDFIEHSYVKDKIIAAIEKDPEGEEYSDILKVSLVKLLDGFTKQLNDPEEDSPRFTSISYKQYHKKEGSEWHRHPKTWYNFVYYLELPKDVTPTHLQDPYNTENVIEPKGEEGQILIFPSTFIHKIPVSESEGRRTFLSWSLL